MQISPNMKGVAKKICKEKFEGGRLVEIYNNQQQQFLIKYLKKVEKEYQCIDPSYYWDYYDDDGIFDYIYYTSSNQELCSEIAWWIGLERNRDSPQDFQWLSGNPVSFTWWDEWNPYPRGRCVHMTRAGIPPQSPSGQAPGNLRWSAGSCSDYDGLGPRSPVCQIL